MRRPVVKGGWLLTKSGKRNKIPRAFVLYPTQKTPDSIAVPAGVDEVEITLQSALGTGDSAALLGAVDQHACDPPTP